MCLNNVRVYEADLAYVLFTRFAQWLMIVFAIFLILLAIHAPNVTMFARVLFVIMGLCVFVFTLIQSKKYIRSLHIYDKKILTIKTFLNQTSIPLYDLEISIREVRKDFQYSLELKKKTTKYTVVEYVHTKNHVMELHQHLCSEISSAICLQK